jgi:hypothetical protein
MERNEMRTDTETTRITDRIRKLAVTVQLTLADSPGANARIGSYKAADETEHAVVISRTANGDWEVRDLAAGHNDTVDTLPGALEEAVKTALTYAREREQDAIRSRAKMIARAVLRGRAALHGDRLHAPVSSRRAA